MHCLLAGCPKTLLGMAGTGELMLQYSMVLVFGPNGKVQCQRVPMGDTMFVDGMWQHLYFPDYHPDSPGIFKGMAVILEECGYSASTLLVECKGFKCPKMPLIFVASAPSSMSQILPMLNPFWRQPAKPEAFRFYFCPSSIAN